MTGPAKIQLARLEPRCDVLGPGTRAVVWVAGCPLRCAGCIAPEWLPADAGEAVDIAELASRILAIDAIDGVTYSGGEPFAQAAALVELSDALRGARPDLSLMSFSGFTLGRLLRGGSAERALLARLDVLVDGPYVRARHRPLRWRGSSNQQIRLLTDRHADLRHIPDLSAGIEVMIDGNGNLSIAGVPPTADFRARLLSELRDGDIEAKGGGEA